MDIPGAKELVCRSGLRLQEQGLVARTWGNISCRADENRFVITPSGITYSRLTPDDMMVVNIHDLAFAGNTKPSSESGVHAGIYQSRPEITAVIHTHQAAASSVSAGRERVVPLKGEAAAIIGHNINIAGYALPGTRKLIRSALNALGNNYAVLLGNHGAICIGTDMDHAFKVAMTLETACQEFVLERFSRISGIRHPDLTSLHEWYLNTYSGR